jgi:tripartite-type tricarboxylate transporter receptor subunit TctC
MGDDHLRLLLLEEMVPGLTPGESFKAVHGRGAADSIALVLGGHTDILAVNVGEVVGLVRDEEVRVLAVSDAERSPFLPDVPTLKELGWPIINHSARGIGGPAGIPGHILDILIEAFAEGMMHPEHVAAMEKVGLALRPITGDEYRQMHLEEERIIREMLDW